MIKSMNNFGFIRVAAAVCGVKVADVDFSILGISTLVNRAYQDGVSLISFPELAITGATCGDLFEQSLLIAEAEKATERLINQSRGKDITIVVGVPVQFRGRLYNCAAVIRNGNLKGLVPKIYHGSANEARWFSSGADFLNDSSYASGHLLDNGKDCIREGFGAEICFAGQRCCISPAQLFEIGNATFAVEIGSDINAVIPPSAYHTIAGAQIIVNIAVENDYYTMTERRERQLREHSVRTKCAYMYSSAVGESSQDTVCPGTAYVWEAGRLLASHRKYSGYGYYAADIDLERIDILRRKSNAFTSIAPDGTAATSYSLRYNRISLGKAAETDFNKEFFGHVEAHPFCAKEGLEERCREILDIQVEGLVRRIERIGSKAVIGISGGLDSTLALLVTVLAFDRLRKFDAKWDRSNIIAVTMPGFGTTSRTKGNAWELMNALGVTCREISIVPACEQHFKDIGHDMSVHDATYENSQARERTQILMDIANQTGGIVVGTGDLSELALGWATYNGDHMSMYGVNAGIPKTLVRSLVIWAAHNRFTQVKDILLDIADTPISPELLPADENGNIKQVTEDLVGPYELHDFFIYNFMRYGYSPEKIRFLAKMAFQNPEKDSSVGTYSDETISKWLKTFIRRFFSQQFKRSCMPDGPAVGSISLSPRGGWNMPSDAYDTLFSKNL